MSKQIVVNVRVCDKGITDPADVARDVVRIADWSDELDSIHSESGSFDPFFVTKSVSACRWKLLSKVQMAIIKDNKIDLRCSDVSVW